MTQHRLLLDQQARAEEEAKENELRALEAKRIQLPIELTPNINQTEAERVAKEEAVYGKGNVIEASGVDAALATLSVAVDEEKGSNLDKHPEKRMRAAHLDYEERMMPIVKEDHPGLKRSQYKEMIWKMWQKAPENPLVQAAREQLEAMQQGGD